MDKKFFRAQICILSFVIILAIMWLIFWRREGIELYLIIAALAISLLSLIFILLQLSKLK
ncbi:MAG TPA: hypothetical protein PLJ96_00605 [Candidatus Atribacteria bacterium]|nr:hypothetical protein [Candidatus Atribacteria bacterium]